MPVQEQARLMRLASKLGVSRNSWLLNKIRRAMHTDEKRIKKISEREDQERVS